MQIPVLSIISQFLSGWDQPGDHRRPSDCWWISLIAILQRSSSQRTPHTRAFIFHDRGFVPATHAPILTGSASLNDDELVKTDYFVRRLFIITRSSYTHEYGARHHVDCSRAERFRRHLVRIRRPELPKCLMHKMKVWSLKNTGGLPRSKLRQCPRTGRHRDAVTLQSIFKPILCLRRCYYTSFQREQLFHDQCRSCSLPEAFWHHLTKSVSSP